MSEALVRAGVEMHMGMKMPSIMRKVGLVAPEVQASTLIGGGPDWAAYRYGEDTLRSMLPVMEALGVVTATEVDIDTFAARLEAEALRLDSTLMLSTWIGCWARKV